MSQRRFLLMHTTTSLGHHRASANVEQAIRALDPHAEVVSLDAFQFTSRMVRWAILRTYLSLIRHQPDVWEYLYDNPRVHRRVQVFRTLLHRYQASEFQRVLETVRPDAIACTQAYPCGIAADFKKHHHLTTPLIGVLTDHAPHLYWFHETVDAYVVPSEQVKQRFLTRGVEAHRVKVLGIPIDQRFQASKDCATLYEQLALDSTHPIILIMGGGSGFGHLREIVRHLDGLPDPCQLVVLAGTNRRLVQWVRQQRFRQHVVAMGYTEEIPQLMRVATLLVSKPGGLTTSEALASQLPLVIVNPIPGQEAYNARYLLSHGAAVLAGSTETIRQTVRDLLDDPDRLASMRRRAAELARPTAAHDVATLLFELANRYSIQRACSA